MNRHIAIIGAGPAGLGAAYRLAQLGERNWTLYERSDRIGGLAASFKDAAGFVWDQGGHVLFTRDDCFARIADHLLGDAFCEHVRASWICCGGRYVPYPFQNNIRYLSDDGQLACIRGLADRPDAAAPPTNFAEWIDATFGEGIAALFMRPYNRKVWTWPLGDMSADWIADRVPVIDLVRVLKNMIHARDDVAWGPNSTFKYPSHGGTGGLWQRLEPVVRGHLHLRREVVAVDPPRRTIHLADGARVPYEVLINTSPLDVLVPRIAGAPPAVRGAGENLCFNSGWVVGLGFAGRCPSRHNWVYFPEVEFPFYRITYLSNYSPNVCPPGEHFSILLERSFSEYAPVDEAHVAEEAIAGLLAAGVISLTDVANLVSVWRHRIERSYPIPTLGRDRALRTIAPFLARCKIHSVGRFGAWRYEQGNQDHSFMAGVRAVERILGAEPMTPRSAVRAASGVEVHA
jgi:protoporphyrinogen oxidase